MLCFHASQTGKHLLRTRNVSEQNQKHFLCPGHKICVRNKCCARGQTGKHLCRQQCVRNNVSSFARAFKRVVTSNFSDVRNLMFVDFGLLKRSFWVPDKGQLSFSERR